MGCTARLRCGAVCRARHGTARFGSVTRPPRCSRRLSWAQLRAAPLPCGSRPCFSVGTAGSGGGRRGGRGAAPRPSPCLFAGALLLSGPVRGSDGSGELAAVPPPQPVGVSPSVRVSPALCPARPAGSWRCRRGPSRWRPPLAGMRGELPEPRRARSDRGNTAAGRGAEPAMGSCPGARNTSGNASRRG